jgi:hypothetical protein
VYERRLPQKAHGEGEALTWGEVKKKSMEEVNGGKKLMGAQEGKGTVVYGSALPHPTE